MTEEIGTRELLARAVHERYRQNQQGRKPPGDPSMQPWEALAGDLRESNRQQADDIAAKLRRIGCGIMPVAGPQPAPLTFTPEEIEIMAEMEHDRWVAERRTAGWVYGPARDVEHRISPYLVPWAELPNDVKKWDREAVRAIPEVLAQAQLRAYRLSGGAPQAGNSGE
jgi:hypothetical protein